MPFSSGYFLAFKWWTIPGVDAAIWICQKRYYQATDRAALAETVRNQTDLDWTLWLTKLLNLGQPAILDRLKTGTDNIWLTDVTISQYQRTGIFPQLFHNVHFPDIAGITLKTIPGSDRPDAKPTDLILDIIVTITPADMDTPSPVLHRQQIPLWTEDQRTGFGRYTTGPVFTQWDRI